MAMKLIEDLIGRAKAADDRAGQLAQREGQRLERQKAYNQLEELFNDMAADGYLDKDELKTLMKKFREAGLSTDALDKLYQQLKNTDRVAAGASIREAVGDELQNARTKDRADVSFQFEVQNLMTDYHQSFDLAARVQKAEHDMYMAAIQNLKA